jgi:hypothetical protein
MVGVVTRIILLYAIAIAATAWSAWIIGPRTVSVPVWTVPPIVAAR